MHRSTLELKLRVVRFYKLLPVVRALDSSMLRNTGERMTLHRILPSETLWSDDQWLTWCQALGGQDTLGKAPCELMAQRADHASRVRAWKDGRLAARCPPTTLELSKRPAAAIVKLSSGKPGVKKLTRYTEHPKAARLLKRPSHGPQGFRT